MQEYCTVEDIKELCDIEDDDSIEYKEDYEV